MREKIINEFSFLGINLYSRKRISDIEITSQNGYEKEFLVGLYPLIKYPKLEFDYISLYQQKDWDKTAEELFYKAFMHLFFVKAIHVNCFKDQKNILGIYNFQIEGFHIKLKNTYATEDIFLNLVLKSIKETNKKHGSKSKLDYNIQYIIDGVLGSKSKEYNRPEKKFITRLIKRYTRKYFWLELEKETKYFGMVSMYKVKIEDSRLLLLNDSFRSLSSISIQEKSNNIHLRKFEKDLSIIIRNDFQTRYPSNDTDTD